MSSPVLYTRNRDRNSAASRVSDRLRHQINSVIVPNNNYEEEEVHLLVESDDQQSTGTAAESPYYRNLSLRPQFDLRDLSCGPGAILDAVVIDSEWMYFILEDSHHLYTHRLSSSTIAISEDVDDEAPITTVPLKLENDQQFFPRHLRFDEQSRSLYISGFTFSIDSNERINLLAKFSLSASVQNRSKLFPVVEKFGDFDFTNKQSAAGLWIASNGTSTDRPDKCQVFKLSNDFRKKMNFVDLNSGSQRYIPNFLATDDSFVYVSVTKISSREDDPEEQKEEGRILTFPAFQRGGTQVDSKAQEWLHVNSWDFRALSPGKLVSLSSNSMNLTIGCRLLVVDRRYGSLHLIIWRCSEPSGKPLCLPVRCNIGSADRKIPPVHRLVLHKNQIFVICYRQVFVGQTTGLTEDIDFLSWATRDPRC